MNIGLVAIDEASELNEEDYDELSGRLRCEYGCRQIVAATNPSVPGHFLYQRFYESRMKDYKLIETTTYDNPFLPLDYVKDMESKDQRWVERMVMGKWIALEDAVYREFNRKIHVKKRAHGEMKEFYLSADYGFTNPTALLLFGVDGDGNIHVFKEFKRSLMRLSEIVEKSENYKKMCECVIYDPSAPALGEEFSKEGWTAEKADNSVDKGIATARDYIFRNRITIEPECVELVKELESYQYNKEGKVIKVNDHLSDALRYGVQHVANRNLQNRQNKVFVFGAGDFGETLEEEIEEDEF
jgi:phage terminase large subunit